MRRKKPLKEQAILAGIVIPAWIIMTIPLLILTTTKTLYTFGWLPAFLITIAPIFFSKLLYKYIDRTLDQRHEEREAEAAHLAAVSQPPLHEPDQWADAPALLQPPVAVVSQPPPLPAQLMQEVPVISAIPGVVVPPAVPTGPRIERLPGGGLRITDRHGKVHTMPGSGHPPTTHLPATPLPAPPALPAPEEEVSVRYTPQVRITMGPGAAEVHAPVVFPTAEAAPVPAPVPALAPIPEAASYPIHAAAVHVRETPRRTKARLFGEAAGWTLLSGSLAISLAINVWISIGWRDLFHEDRRDTEMLRISREEMDREQATLVRRANELHERMNGYKPEIQRKEKELLAQRSAEMVLHKRIVAQEDRLVDTGHLSRRTRPRSWINKELEELLGDPVTRRK